MIRLDKYLADMGIGTRSEVKQYLKKGLVTVNGSPEKYPDRKIDPLKAAVCFRGEPVAYAAHEYYMFYKPAGCVTATTDPVHKTVLDYFEGVSHRELFPVGRLDIDTEGLLLLTDDGPLCHQLLAPGRHVEKTYFARVEGELNQDKIPLFAQGLDIGDEKLTRPAKLEILKTGECSEILLTITEGRFHQVKRMFEAVGSKVLYLKRVSMGGVVLDETLKPGEYRALKEDELFRLTENDRGRSESGKGKKTGNVEE